MVRAGARLFVSSWSSRLGGLCAVVIALAACLPAPPPSQRAAPPALVPAPSGWNAQSGPVRNLLALPPVPFEENRGQADPRVRFLAHAGSLTAYYGDTGVRYSLVGHDPAEVDAALVQACARSRFGPDAGCETLPPTKRWWLSQSLVGARAAPPIALDPAETVVSYMVGKHGFVGPERDWTTGVPTCHRLAYQDAWPGIDVGYERAGPRDLKSSYHLQPGADPRAIRVRWRGGTARLAEDGALELTTPLGVVREAAPLAWQEIAGRRVQVAVRYQILSPADGDLGSAEAEAEVGVALGAFDATRPLTIDPLLTYASYIGGSGADTGSGIAVDGSGNAYVTGFADSTQATFPNGNGFGAGPGQANVPGFDQSYNGGNFDAFVVKLAPDGRSLAYATYLGGAGGNDSDGGSAIALDSSGNAYVAGSTTSTQTDFPDGDPNNNDQMDVPGFDQTHNGGGNDAFVAKLPDPTSTFTPTPTSTLTPVPTATPGPCAPRPLVGVQVVAVGGGKLRVTLTTSQLPATPGNKLIQVRFGSAPNAVVEDATGVSPPPPPPAGATSYTVFVRRTGQGGVAFPLIVVDQCGEWPTFVGGGPSAF